MNEKDLLKLYPEFRHKFYFEYDESILIDVYICGFFSYHCMFSFHFFMVSIYDLICERPFGCCRQETRSHEHLYWLLESIGKVL